MTTPTVRQMLLALAAGFVVAFALLLVFDDDTGAAPAETCGRQELTVTDTAVSVDPQGCPVDLYVWTGNGTAEDVFVLPQQLHGFKTGTGVLELGLPYGWYQVDVFSAGAFDLGDKLTEEDFNANPRLWFDLLAGSHGFKECTPLDPEPAPDKPTSSTTIDRPPTAVATAAAAAAVTAPPRFAG